MERLYQNKQIFFLIHSRKDEDDEYFFSYLQGEHPLEIFLEYEVVGEAIYLYRYAITESRGVWLFLETKTVCVGLDVSESEPVFEAAGHGRDEAVHFMIDVILARTKELAGAPVEVTALEAALKSRLIEAVAY